MVAGTGHGGPRADALSTACTDDCTYLCFERQICGYNQVAAPRETRCKRFKPKNRGQVVLTRSTVARQGGLILVAMGSALAAITYLERRRRMVSLAPTQALNKKRWRCPLQQLSLSQAAGAYDAADPTPSASASSDDDIEALLSSYRKRRDATNARLFSVILNSIIIALFGVAGYFVAHNFFIGELGGPKQLDLNRLDFKFGIDLAEATTIVVGLLALVGALTVAIAAADRPDDDQLRDVAAARRAVWVAQTSYLSLLSGLAALIVSLIAVPEAPPSKHGTSVLLVVLGILSVAISATVVGWTRHLSVSKLENSSEVARLEIWIKEARSQSGVLRRRKVVSTFLVALAMIVVVATILGICGIAIVAWLQHTNLLISARAVLFCGGVAAYFAIALVVGASQLFGAWSASVTGDRSGYWSSRVLAWLIVLVAALVVGLAVTAVPRYFAYVLTLLATNWFIVVLLPFLLVHNLRPAFPRDAWTQRSRWSGRLQQAVQDRVVQRVDAQLASLKKFEL